MIVSKIKLCSGIEPIRTKIKNLKKTKYMKVVLFFCCCCFCLFSFCCFSSSFHLDKLFRIMHLNQLKKFMMQSFVDVWTNFHTVKKKKYNNNNNNNNNNKQQRKKEI